MQKLIYKGKTKNIFSTTISNEIIAEFKDDITAFNNKRTDSIAGKGTLTASISIILFKHLTNNNIENHFIKTESSNQLRLTKLIMLPIEVIVRNITKGSLCKNLNIKEGIVLNNPIIEIHLKDDLLKDPLVNDDQLLSLKLIKNTADLQLIKETAIKTNKTLKNLFELSGIDLADFKIEFGYDNEGNIILGDELSPDNMRLVDKKTTKSLDKDLFRNNSGSIIEAYTEVLNRIQEIKIENAIKNKYIAEIFIIPRKDILNPESIAIKDTLKDIGYDSIEKVEVGKYLKVQLNCSSKLEAKQNLEKACNQFIANPVIEDYKIRII